MMSYTPARCPSPPTASVAGQQCAADPSGGTYFAALPLSTSQAALSKRSTSRLVTNARLPTVVGTAAGASVGPMGSGGRGGGGGAAGSTKCGALPFRFYFKYIALIFTVVVVIWYVGYSIHFGKSSVDGHSLRNRVAISGNHHGEGAAVGTGGRSAGGGLAPVGGAAEGSGAQQASSSAAHAASGGGIANAVDDGDGDGDGDGGLGTRGGGVMRSAAAAVMLPLAADEAVEGVYPFVNCPAVAVAEGDGGGWGDGRAASDADDGDSDDVSFNPTVMAALRRNMTLLHRAERQLAFAESGYAAAAITATNIADASDAKSNATTTSNRSGPNPRSSSAAAAAMLSAARTAASAAHTLVDVQLFAVWPGAMKHLHRILRDMRRKFVVLRIVHVDWTAATTTVSAEGGEGTRRGGGRGGGGGGGGGGEPTLAPAVVSASARPPLTKEEKFLYFEENLWRLYSGKGGLRRATMKTKVGQCGGVGKFVVIIVADPSPQYQDEVTAHGVDHVNRNMFQAKRLYRQWSGEGGFRVHGTYSSIEAEHDARVLLGERPYSIAARALLGGGGGAEGGDDHSSPLSSDAAPPLDLSKTNSKKRKKKGHSGGPSADTIRGLVGRFLAAYDAEKAATATAAAAAAATAGGGGGSADTSSLSSSASASCRTITSRMGTLGFPSTDRFFAANASKLLPVASNRHAKRQKKPAGAAADRGADDHFDDAHASNNDLQLKGEKQHRHHHNRRRVLQDDRNGEEKSGGEELLPPPERRYVGIAEVAADEEDFQNNHQQNKKKAAARGGGNSALALAVGDYLYSHNALPSRGEMHWPSCEALWFAMSGAASTITQALDASITPLVVVPSRRSSSSSKEKKGAAAAVDAFSVYLVGSAPIPPPPPPPSAPPHDSGDAIADSSSRRGTRSGSARTSGSSRSYYHPITFDWRAEDRRRLVRNTAAEHGRWAEAEAEAGRLPMAPRDSPSDAVAEGNANERSAAAAAAAAALRALLDVRRDPFDLVQLGSGGDADAVASSAAAVSTYVSPRAAKDLFVVSGGGGGNVTAPSSSSPFSSSSSSAALTALEPIFVPIGSIPPLSMHGQLQQTAEWAVARHRSANMADGGGNGESSSLLWQEVLKRLRSVGNIDGGDGSEASSGSNHQRRRPAPEQQVPIADADDRVDASTLTWLECVAEEMALEDGSRGSSEKGDGDGGASALIGMRRAVNRGGGGGRKDGDDDGRGGGVGGLLPSSLFSSSTSTSSLAWLLRVVIKAPPLPSSSSLAEASQRAGDADDPLLPPPALQPVRPQPLTASDEATLKAYKKQLLTSLYTMLSATYGTVLTPIGRARVLSLRGRRANGNGEESGNTKETSEQQQQQHGEPHAYAGAYDGTDGGDDDAIPTPLIPPIPIEVIRYAEALRRGEKIAGDDAADGERRGHTDDLLFSSSSSSSSSLAWLLGDRLKLLSRVATHRCNLAMGSIGITQPFAVVYARQRLAMQSLLESAVEQMDSSSEAVRRGMGMGTMRGRKGAPEGGSAVVMKAFALPSSSSLGRWAVGRRQQRRRNSVKAMLTNNKKGAKDTFFNSSSDSSSSVGSSGDYSDALLLPPPLYHDAAGLFSGDDDGSNGEEEEERARAHYNDLGIRSGALPPIARRSYHHGGVQRGMRKKKDGMPPIVGDDIDNANDAAAADSQNVGAMCMNGGVGVMASVTVEGIGRVFVDICLQL